MIHQQDQVSESIDVSRRAWLRRIWAVYERYYPVLIVGFLIILTFHSPNWIFQIVTQRTWGWEGWLTVGIVVAVCVGGILAQRLDNNWTYLAARPTKEWASGRREAADRAYEKALAYAQKLDNSDYRRGAILYTLANYLATSGRRKEAAAFFEECITLLETCDPKLKSNYFNALIDYGTFHFYARDFKSAQRLYELALDTLPSLKKVDLPYFDAKMEGTMEATLLLNLIGLFLEGNCLPEAEKLLDKVEPLIARTTRSSRKAYADMALARRCLLHYLRGEYDAVEREADRAYDPKMVAPVRYMVLLARGKFAEAEAMIKDVLQSANAPPGVRYPWNLEPLLDLAEAQYGQGKHDGAFGSFEEARSMVAEFAMPPDALWRMALATWAGRARALGRGDLAAVLEAELAAATATPDQAITILDRFRGRGEESANTD